MEKRAITLGSVSITDREREYIKQVLDTTLVGPFSLSKKVADTVASLHGFQYGRYLNSGQSALTIALRAIIKQRKMVFETRKPVVAVPSCTYISTLAACIFADCNIKLIDVSLKDINMNPNNLEEALAAHEVDIVMPVHLCGKPASRLIKDLCEQYNVPIVVDSCETIFAPRDLDWGDVVCFSTFSNHTIGAGAGGIVCTNSKELDFLMFQQISHGRENENPGSDPASMGDRFRFSDWGESLKPSDLYAAVALGAIERRKDIIELQRANAIRLTSLIKDLPLILPDEDNHTFMFYPIVVSDHDIDMTKLLGYLHEQQIYTRRLMPITNQPIVLKHFGMDQDDMDQIFFKAAYINEYGFYVGSHPGLTSIDIDYLGHHIREGLKNATNG